MDYINFIRNKPCSICFNPAPNDPHHLIAIGMGRNRNKLTEREHIEKGVVPLCRKHHQEFHNGGLKKFDKDNNSNLWADAYYWLMRYMESNNG